MGMPSKDAYRIAFQIWSNWLRAAEHAERNAPHRPPRAQGQGVRIDGRNPIARKATWHLRSAAQSRDRALHETPDHIAKRARRDAIKAQAEWVIAHPCSCEGCTPAIAA